MLYIPVMRIANRG